MWPFSEIWASPGGAAIIIFAILLLFLQLVLLVLAFASRRRTALAAFSAAWVIFGILFLTLLLDYTYDLGYLPYRREFLGCTAAFAALPWLVLVFMELAAFVVTIICIVRFLRRSRAEVTPYSIKEAIDFLPVGICVGGADGSVLLSNLQMKEIFASVTGRTLTNAGELAETFAVDTFARAQEKGARSAEGSPRENQPTTSAATMDGSSLLESGGRTFVFTQGKFTVNDKAYTETIIEDQTEQYEKTKELEEKNARLRDIQYRLKAFRVHDEELLIRRELLEARKTVHNELGAALLTGKYYFEHPESVEEKELLSMLRQINTYLLAEVEEPEDRRDEYASALKMARQIGIKVTVAGEVPQDGPFREIAGLALGECAANTVKHAAGSEVFVTFSETDGMPEAVFANDGEPPRREITETGGLLSLRHTAEAAGFSMEIRSLPAFRLTLRAPVPAHGSEG